jgi:hypothetical protein
MYCFLLVYSCRLVSSVRGGNAHSAESEQIWVGAFVILIRILILMESLTVHIIMRSQIVMMLSEIGIAQCFSNSC